MSVLDALAQSELSTLIRGLALQGISDTDGGEYSIIINWVYVDMNVIINRVMDLDGRNAFYAQPYVFRRIN
jgi:hypothetical protein